MSTVEVSGESGEGGGEHPLRAGRRGAQPVLFLTSLLGASYL
ncbi:MAG: hypothetical protein R2734_17715 [Nocardioides sp.]